MGLAMWRLKSLEDEDMLCLFDKQLTLQPKLLQVGELNCSYRKVRSRDDCFKI